MQEQEFIFDQSVMAPLAGLSSEETPRVRRRKVSPRRDSKKRAIIEHYHAGTTSIMELARTVKTRPSYVASVLQDAGLIHGYFDLYTTTARDQNTYSRHFRNALSFKSVEAARESIERIKSLYNYFDSIGDRAGQHHAEVLALTGRNRARWSGKKEEAKIFEDWLFNH